MRSHTAPPAPQPTIEVVPTAASPLPIRQDDADVRASAAFCREVARREAKNFYWSFRLLPRAERQAMCALYAFMRHTDDLADSDAPAEQREEALIRWKATVSEVLTPAPHAEMQPANGSDSLPNGIWPGFPALAAAVRAHGIPLRYLEAVIDGVAGDVRPVRIGTSEEFDRYCWHVASAVGLCCLHIWGFESHDGRAEALAERLGIAFQRTNILRDVAEDYALGRVYLPADRLAAFGVAEADLAAPRASADLKRLVAAETATAREGYRAANDLLPLISPRCRPMLRAISRIYEGVLNTIERQRYDVLVRRARVPKWQKIAIMIGAALG